MGQEICPTCGLPKDLCTCSMLAMEEQRIRVHVEKRKWGKAVTVVSGLDEKDVDLGQLATKLKNYCACGGTAKEGHVELQGDHREKVRDYLVKEGYRKDFIDLR